jgi:hypothetical protein
VTVASLCGPTCGTPLFLHVLGAVTLFGSVLAVTILAYAAFRLAPEQAQLVRRIGFWTTLVLMVPAWILMYWAGAWVLDYEGLDKNEPGWVDRGLDIAHIGAALTLLLLLFGWLSTRRPRLGGVLAALATIYLLALGVAWFAMSGKPDW